MHHPKDTEENVNKKAQVFSLACSFDHMATQIRLTSCSSKEENIKINCDMNCTPKARYNKGVLAEIIRLLGRLPMINDRIHVMIDNFDFTFRVYRANEDGQISMHTDCHKKFPKPNSGGPVVKYVIVYGVTHASVVYAATYEGDDNDGE